MYKILMRMEGSLDSFVTMKENHVNLFGANSQAAKLRELGWDAHVVREEHQGINWDYKGMLDMMLENSGTMQMESGRRYMVGYEVLPDDENNDFLIAVGPDITELDSGDDGTDVYFRVPRNNAIGAFCDRAVVGLHNQTYDDDLLSRKITEEEFVRLQGIIQVTKMFGNVTIDMQNIFECLEDSEHYYDVHDEIIEALHEFHPVLMSYFAETEKTN